MKLCQAPAKTVIGAEDLKMVHIMDGPSKANTTETNVACFFRNYAQYQQIAALWASATAASTPGLAAVC